MPAAKALLLTLPLLTGCYGTLATHTVQFSTQAAPTLDATRAVYTLVATEENRRARTQAIQGYETTPYTQAHVTTQFGTAKDQAARTAILTLLQTYIDSLAAAAGDKALANLHASSQAAGQALASAAQQYAPKVASTTSTATSAPLSSDDATAAIEILGRLLAEHARARALPRILQSADPAITTITTLLRRDLQILRPVLAADYQTIEAYQDAALRNNPRGYSQPERQAAIDALFTTVQQAKTSDATLSTVDAALAKLAETHHALAQSSREKDATTFRARLAELIAEAQQLSALQSKATPAP